PHEQPAVRGVLRRVERGELVAEGQLVAVFLDDRRDVVALERDRHLDERAAHGVAVRPRLLVAVDRGRLLVAGDQPDVPERVVPDRPLLPHPLVEGIRVVGQLPIAEQVGAGEIGRRHRGLVHGSRADQPPSTGMIAPETNDARSEHRNAATSATSSGRPPRPSDAFFAISGNCDPPDAPMISVSMNPGQTQFTRTPLRPYSADADLVSETTPALAALYTEVAIACSDARNPPTDDQLTTAPPPASRRRGMPYFMPRKTPRRSTSITVSKSLISVLWIGPPIPMPATLRTASTCPNSATAASNSAATSGSML